MVEIKIIMPENMKNLLKGEAASKGFYFKDYIFKIIEERRK